MNERTVLIDLHFLPSLEYFACIHSFDRIVLEAHESYQKQSYRNRCYIRGANKIQLLTVPVSKEKERASVRDVKISYSQKWWKEQMKSIESAYGKAPFFQYYAEIFEKTYNRKPVFLFDLNLEFLTICLELLGYNKRLTFSETYLKLPEKGVYDARGLIRPGKNYRMNGFYKPFPYYQVFGKVFDENLSVLDLLYCEGRNGKDIIAKSAEI